MIQRCCVQWRLPDCGAFSWLPILHARKGRLQDIAELFSVPGKASSNDYEEHRNKKIASSVAVSIPPITPVPTAFCARCRHHG